MGSVNRLETDELIGVNSLQTDEPIACNLCNMRLNGQNQFADHLRGKRHRKNLLRNLLKQRQATIQGGEMAEQAEMAPTPMH